MNVNDFEAPQERQVDLLQGMMDKQASLMGKYHGIEKASGLLQTESCPVDIHSKQGQARLKDFSWRVTEEFMEALEAFNDNDLPHFEEELIDALHFTLEQHLLLGMNSRSVVDWFADKGTIDNWAISINNRNPLEMLWEYATILAASFNVYSSRDSVRLLMLKSMEYTGLAMNCLKNKPWKQTNMLTDIPKFRENIAMAFVYYLAMMYKAGFTPEKIYDLYFRKAQVNNFRQESKY